MNHHLSIALISALVLLSVPQTHADAPANIREEMRMSAPLLTDTQVQQETLPLVAASTDSLVRVTTRLINTYIDTIRVVRYSQDSLPRIDTSYVAADSTGRKGHYIQAYIGGGYGSIGFHLNDAHGGKVTGFVTGRLQAQYAWFFHPNWGVGAGLWFTNYTSIAHIGGEYRWTQDKNGNPLVDSDVEQNYHHIANIQKWRERETIHNFAIPISLQFQYKKDDWKARIFAELGIAPSFAVSKKYRVLEGEVAHSGYYPAWELTLDRMHEFATIDYKNAPQSKGTLSVRPQVAIFADLGALLPLTPQIELFLGGYFNIVANDANSSDRRDIGWKDATFTFMDEYAGAYATTNASASHPFEVGVKVGVHWHYIKPDKHEIVDYFDYFTRQDTMVDIIHRRDTIISERIDTLTRAHIAKAAEEVEKFNKIYFDFDSHQLSEESQNYLSSIVSVLNKVPDAKIAIDGHASEEGQRRHNERLAYNRAKAVAKYLVEQGIDKKRVIVIGHGSLVPNEENVNHELPLDRRAEVKVVQKQSEIK